MPSVLITGANRGLGLEFVRQYLAGGWDVHACFREQGDLLPQYAGGNLALHTLDVADFDQIEQLAGALSGKPIDLLICNAGIHPQRGNTRFGNTNYEAFAMAYRVNAMAPLKMAEAFVGHVAGSKGKKMAFITSKMGSMADNTSGGSYIYRSSKAALNMVVKSLSIDLAPLGIVTALLHPGWVKTDMGGPNAWITPEQSVTGMRKVIDRLNPSDSGEFYAYDGQLIPW
jgi:NAD(P)-dependent dehydrogenase (short-subunit alcohol dehydrogenase family)